MSTEETEDVRTVEELEDPAEPFSSRDSRHDGSGYPPDQCLHCFERGEGHASMCPAQLSD